VEGLKTDVSALALRRRESGGCGLCWVRVENGAAMLLVGAWQRENSNK